MTVGQPFRKLLVGGQGIPLEDFFYYADFELGGVKKVLGSFNPHGSQAHDEGELAHAVTMPCADFFPLLESSPGARLSK